jgi:tetratricopeptide (TPR) repeat protein
MKKKRWVFSLIFWLSLCQVWAQKDDSQLWAWQKNIEKLGETAEKLSLLNQLCGRLAVVAPQEALQYAESAQKLAQKLNDKKAECTALNNMGKAYINLEAYSKAQSNLQKSLQIAENQQDILNKCYALNHLAHIQWLNGSKSEAMLTFQKSKSIAEKSGNYLALADNYVQSAQCNSSENPDEALKNYAQALKIYEQNSLALEAGNTAQAIALLYSQNKQDAGSALQYHQKALHIGDQLSDKRLLTDNLNFTGAIYQNTKQDAKTALRYYFQAFIIGQEYDFYTNGTKVAQSLKGIYTCYQTLAKQAQNHGEEGKAQEYDKFAKSYQNLYQNIKLADYDVELYKTTQEPRIYTRSNTLIEPNTNKKAKAKSDASPKNTNPNEKRTNKNRSDSILAEAEKLAKMRFSADSVLILQKDSQIARLQTKNSLKDVEYNQLSDEKNAQEAEARKYKYIWLGTNIAAILILFGTLMYALYLQRAQKKVIFKQKEKLVQNNEKINRQTVLLREQEASVLKKEAELSLAHAKLDDAKLESNSMTYMLQEEVYYPLVSLLVNAYQENADRTWVYQSGKQILNTLYTLLEVQNFSYTTLQLQNQSVASVFQRTIEQMSQIVSKKKIHIENQIPASIQAYFDAGILERVFFNLLQNSLKYTPEGGYIHVEAFKHPHHIEIHYHDSGKSVLDKYLHLIFTKYAPEEARPSALGMPYVKTAVEKQGGTIEVSNTAQTLKFILQLPTQSA